MNPTAGPRAGTGVDGVGVTAGTGPADRFTRAQAIADTILWEGYALYPYRRSSAKNQLRFNWGVVGPGEDPRMESSVLLGEGYDGALDVRVRFLRLVSRSDGWDEAEVVERDIHIASAVGLADRRTAGGTPGSVRLDVLEPGSLSVGADGFERRAEAVEGLVEVSARRRGENNLVTVAVSSSADDVGDYRANLQRSMVGTHVLLASDGDGFVSCLEPPEELADVVGELRQHRAWPVLVGPGPARDLVLASPVILYDYPSVTQRSAGDFYDSTEIDELLALRVHTLTDAEKAEARALDPRTRAIIDRHDTLDPAVMGQLHGASYGPHVMEGAADRGAPVDPSPEWSDPGPQRIRWGSGWIEPGSKVRLAPSKRADVHDMFLEGRVATVAQIVHDVDGGIHVGITVDDDPAADLFRVERRYLFFAPEEVVPMAPGGAPGDAAASDSDNGIGVVGKDG